MPVPGRCRGPERPQVMIRGGQSVVTGAGETVRAGSRDPIASPIGGAGDTVSWLEVVRILCEPDAGRLARDEAGAGGDPLPELRRLESLLKANPAQCGGLRLLDVSAQPGAPDEPTEDAPDLLASVALDEFQQRAVRQGLRRSRLTLIEGRAGSGKTAVALALLLNAWMTGRSVLVVGAGGSSSRVVSAWLEELPLQIPIAVRIAPGWRPEAAAKLQRLLQSLRDGEADVTALPDFASLEARRQALERDRVSWWEALRSDFAARLRAAAAEVRNAQAAARERFDALDAQQADLRAEPLRLGLGSLDPEAVETALTATRQWLDRMADYREQGREDDRRRARLEQEIRTQRQRRDQVVAEAELAAAEVSDWEWLLDADALASLANWERRFLACLREPLEAALAPLEWRPEFGRWRGGADAQNWAATVSQLAASVRQQSAELERELERSRDLSEGFERHRVKIRGLGLPDDFDPKPDVIRDWIAVHRELQGHRHRVLDLLPWSSGARLRRRIRHLERALVSHLPSGVQASVGVLDERGRARLASVLEAAQRWSDMRAEQERIRERAEPQRLALRSLRQKALELGVAALPGERDPEPWADVAAVLEEEARIAQSAAREWQRRDAREEVRETLREIARDWALRTSGNPLLEAWCRGPGRPFDRALRTLAVQPDAASLVACRDAIAAGLLLRFRQVWERAANHEHSIRRLQGESAALPGAAARRQAWLHARPADGLLDPGDLVEREWPDADVALAQLDRIADWCVRWRFFRQEDEPRAREQSETIVAAATRGMADLLRQLPPDADTSRLFGLLEQAARRPGDPLPEDRLGDACAAFSRQALLRRIEVIDLELKRGLLEHAQARCLERLRGDAEARRVAESGAESWERGPQTVEGLEAVDDFPALLRALPVWITSVHGVAELPMEAGLFDLVIVDDAPRESLVSLLPAIFRARSLVLLGDPRMVSAPARWEPGVAEAGEGPEPLGATAALARLGHSDDPLRAALARPEEDRVCLAKVYRGHPEVRALSSRLVYPYRRAPSPGGVGGTGECGVGEERVVVVDVPGSAEPGPAGQSWVNRPEAAKVVERVRDLRRRSPASSVGVMTPFSAQRDLLREELRDLESAGGLDIGLPADFQGGEWEVVVFSPVVARGMSADARNRVDRSVDLFAIAMTRARAAMYVIADLEFCLEQEFLLRELAVHCQSLGRLRQDSPDAAGLFAAMLLEGWMPEVQPCIGDIRVDLALDGGPGRRLAIEVDGGEVHHDPARARAREAYLQCMGFRLLRLQGTALQKDPLAPIALIHSGLEMPP